MSVLTTTALNFHTAVMKIYLHIVGHQDLAGLLYHWLWLEFLFAEGVPHGVKVLLTRGVGQIVWRIHVEHSNHIWPAACGRQQRRTGGRGGGTGWLTGVVHTRLTPWNKREAQYFLLAFQWTAIILKLIRLSNLNRAAGDSSSTWQWRHMQYYILMTTRWKQRAIFLVSINNKQHSFAFHCLKRTGDVYLSAFMGFLRFFRDEIIFKKYSSRRLCKDIILCSVRNVIFYHID